MSLIEAMASGLPIIASNVGGIPDMITDMANGILIEPNEEQLFSAIVNIVRDEDKRENIGKGAILASERFSATSMCEKYISIYNS